MLNSRRIRSSDPEDENVEKTIAITKSDCKNRSLEFRLENNITKALAGTTQENSLPLYVPPKRPDGEINTGFKNRINLFTKCVNNYKLP